MPFADVDRFEYEISYCPIYQLLKLQMRAMQKIMFSETYILKHEKIVTNVCLVDIHVQALTLVIYSRGLVYVI